MSFDYKKYKSLPKISTLIVLISFMLPFFLIKCNGTTLASVSGVTLCVGTEVGPKGESSSSSKETITPKIFAIVGLLTAIAGVVIAFIKIRKQILVQLILASLGLLSLIVLNFNMKIALGASSSSQKMITVEMGMGYYLAFLGFLVTVIYCGIALKGEKEAAATVPIEDLVDDE